MTGPEQGRPAVVLLSGGLDSATVLAMAQAMGYSCHALTFDYGQRHRFELTAATRVAAAADVEDHRIVTIDLRLFGGSALTDDLAVPHGRLVHDHLDNNVNADDEIPVTYVPARNTIFLSFALAFAEVVDADDIFIGVNAVDYSGYPDCRPEYIEAFQAMAALATRRGVEGNPATIRAPLLELTKAQIIQRGLALGVDYANTLSCYDPITTGDNAEYRPCCNCDACMLRARGFADANVADPALDGSSSFRA